MVSKGEIWIADLNPAKKRNEVEKIRPVLIFQNNDLNHKVQTLFQELIDP